MDTNKPLISVLIPAYNHENYIQESIQSIIEQTYKNIELIIIDDGSNDSTWQKILEMKSVCENRFTNVIFDTQQNQGTCKTLNKLINYSNGKYIYMIASDDKSKSRAIEVEYNFLSEHPDYGLCVGDNELIDSESRICYWNKKRDIVYNKSKAEFITFGDFLQKISKINFSSEQFGRYDKLYISNHIPNGYLIRRSIFEKIGLFTTEAPLEDYWLMLQLSKYYKMKYLDEILFSYRWHGRNTTVINIEKMIEMTTKTINYEEKLLETIDFLSAVPQVKEVYLNGVTEKNILIPFILYLKVRIKDNIKTKSIYLFNIKIFEYKKQRFYL